MPSSRNRPVPFGVAALVVAGALYPALVYGGRALVPPLAFVAVALALIGARIAACSAPEARVWRLPLAAAAALVGLLAALDGALAAKAYPVALSLGTAAVFGASLRQPPSLVERFARLQEPDLPPAGQAYCRTVTMVWTVWLVVNAAVAGALALWGSDEAWALWTGLIAYIVMGALFGGEVLVRRSLRRRHAGA
ncbi:hypothetical protein [Azospirillum brasilense]|uniref:Intracellular septation protein A n=1 Tax=Azospirillum brasilense TaxID=192 RepID=A0A6L3AT62_AZOBR|nr:hypothetical protein [Azospirillum brasilense]KAA0678511.1 hypothetical protein DS837_27630 [Azospirillum brasilense]